MRTRRTRNSWSRTSAGLIATGHARPQVSKPPVTTARRSRNHWLRTRVKLRPVVTHKICLFLCVTGGLDDEMCVTGGLDSTTCANDAIDLAVCENDFLDVKMYVSDGPHLAMWIHDELASAIRR